jgi:endonuclease YncB( thermonuclease family)
MVRGEGMKVVKGREPLPILLVGVLAIAARYGLKNEAVVDAFTQSSLQSEQWRIKDGSIYDGDTLRVVRGFEIFLNGQIVMDGYAYYYEQYSDSCPNQVVLVEGEAIAQETRVGVWANPGSEKPWEWGRRN